MAGLKAKGADTKAWIVEEISCRRSKRSHTMSYGLGLIIKSYISLWKALVHLYKGMCRPLIIGLNDGGVKWKTSRTLKRIQIQIQGIQDQEVDRMSISTLKYRALIQRIQIQYFGQVSYTHTLEAFRVCLMFRQLKLWYNTLICSFLTTVLRQRDLLGHTRTGNHTLCCV